MSRLVVAALLCWVETASAHARLVVLVTHGASSSPFVYDVQHEGAALAIGEPRPFGIAPAIATVPGGSVHATMAGDDLLVVTQEAARDRSFAGVLWRVSATDATRITDAVCTGSRPIVAGRRAYVTRGSSAVERQDNGARLDALLVTELDLDGGTLRVVAQLVGQAAMPLGVDEDGALLVYAVTPHARGDVLAFDLRSGVPTLVGTPGVEPVARPLVDRSGLSLVMRDNQSLVVRAGRSEVIVPHAAETQLTPVGWMGLP